MVKRKPRRLISPKVKVLDCNCDRRSMQLGTDRFDYCICKVRVEKGRRRALEYPTPDQKYKIGTVFIAAHPKRVWGIPEEQMKRAFRKNR